MSYSSIISTEINATQHTKLNSTQHTKTYSTHMTPFASRVKVIPDVEDAFAIRQKYFKHKWSDQLSNAVSLTPLPCIFWHNQSCLIELSIICCCFFSSVGAQGGGQAQWNLGRQSTDQGVPGSSPAGAPFVVALTFVVTFTPCLVLVKPRKQWTYDRLGQAVTRLETTFCLMC